MSCSLGNARSPPTYIFPFIRTSRPPSSYSSEVDATTLRTVTLNNCRLLHVRYFGMSRRGDRKSTVIYPLPLYTTPKGGKTRPESIAETEDLMIKHTAGGNAVIWHSDGARCYRRLPLNTRVKHFRKQWVKICKLALSDGSVLACYGGTELQDGLWKHLKHRIPTQLSTIDSLSTGTLEKWAHEWAWRYRRGDQACLFSELGLTVMHARMNGDVW